MGAWALVIDFGSVSTVAGTVQAEGSEHSLAQAVRQAYVQRTVANPTININNPVDGTPYVGSCVGSPLVTCTGTGGTTVFFYH